MFNIMIFPLYTPQLYVLHNIETTSLHARHTDNRIVTQINITYTCIYRGPTFIHGTRTFTQQVIIRRVNRDIYHYVTTGVYVYLGFRNCK